ncbi:MAG: LPP20 family lipoprotein [Fibrobacteres bacterium]|nr:LPP20 family lipoprotein [Fibrobacterota bacterium]
MKAILLLIGLITYSFGAGEWVTTGKSQSYPSALYFVGIGLSEKGVGEAKQSAMVEIKKQISVSVKASVMDEMNSFSINGVEKSLSKSESKAKLTTGGDVQGIEVVETTQKGKIFYALAVLEKDKFISNSKTRIQELKKDLATQMQGATDDISAGKIGLGMKKLSAAKRAISEIMEQRTLLSAAAEITAAEQIDVSTNDIAALYEKCVASIKSEKVEGDKQELSVGMVPEIPFLLSVTAEGTPVSGVLVVLLDDNKKKVMEKFTDENGQVSFSLGENINSSVGKHSYTTAIKLPVNSSLQKVLESTNQSFSYEVKSNPCFAKIEVKVSKELAGDLADLTDKTIKLLGKYDVQVDAESDNVVEVSISAKETGNVQGLSEARTFVKTDVTLSFALKQDTKSLVSFEKTAKGTGSTFGKSVAQALPNVGIKADIKMILDKICGASSDTPKKKIAVFPFKNLSGWSDWFNLAESMSDMIITKLINSKKFEVIERSQIDKIMEEKSLGQSGVIEQAEAIQAAKIAGAELLLIGSASIINGKIEVDARVISAATGSALTASNSSGFDVTNLRPLADDIVTKIKVK